MATENAVTVPDNQPQWLAAVPEGVRAGVPALIAKLPPEDRKLLARATVYAGPDYLAGCTTAEDVMEVLQQLAEALKTDEQANYIPAVYTIHHKFQKFQDDEGNTLQGPFKAVVVHFQPTRGFFIEGRKLPLCSAIGTWDTGTAMNDAQEAWSKHNLYQATNPITWAGAARGCNECPFNKYGSDPKTGAGKACKEKYRLFLAPVDADGKLTGEGVMMNVPSTSLKSWDGYKSRLTRYKPKLGGRVEPKLTAQVVTLFELEKAVGQGQDYAKILAKCDRILTAEEWQRVFVIRSQVVKISKELGAEVGESYGEDEPGAATGTEPAGSSPPHDADGVLKENPSGVGF